MVIVETRVSNTTIEFRLCFEFFIGFLLTILFSGKVSRSTFTGILWVGLCL